MCTALAPARGCGRRRPQPRPRQDGTGHPPTRPPATSWKWLSGLWSKTELESQSFSWAPSPHPSQRSLPESPRLLPPAPDVAWPGSRARLCLCHPRALNGLPVCQSKQDPPWVGPEVRRDAEEDRGLFLSGCSIRESLPRALPRALPRDLPRSPVCSNIMDSPLNSPIQGRQGPKGFYNATASLCPSQRHLLSTPACHPDFLPASAAPPPPCFVCLVPKRSVRWDTPFPALASVFLPVKWGN